MILEDHYTILRSKVLKYTQGRRLGTPFPRSRYKLITLNAACEVMDDPQDLDRFFRLAQEKEVGVIAMKVVERGALIERGLDIRQLLPYVLSYPVATAVVGISDVSHLEENVRIASAFEPLSEKEMVEIRALAQS